MLATMTATGAMMGTPHYMSPEQSRGERADIRSDLYSLGVMLYQMLTGSVPFDADMPLAVLRQHIEERARPLRELRREVGQGLASIVERAMEKRPERRFQSASEMAAALRTAVSGIARRAAPAAPQTPHSERTAAPVPARSTSPISASSLTSVDYFRKGNDYANQGDYGKAIEDYDEAIRLDPKYAGAYHSRGQAYGLLGQYERAIEDFDEAIRLDPQYAKAYNNRGNAYQELGQYERAIEDYDEAIRLDPQDAVTYHNRGYAYHNLGQYERAIEDYDEAIRLDPQYAKAYNNRGLAYQSLGKVEEAERDFQKAKELGYNP